MGRIPYFLLQSRTALCKGKIKRERRVGKTKFSKVKNWGVYFIRPEVTCKAEVALQTLVLTRKPRLSRKDK